jgi:hypothetical protein
MQLLRSWDHYGALFYKYFAATRLNALAAVFEANPHARKEFTILNTISAVILLTVMLTLGTFATRLVG